jgi:hypothetical protein
MMMNNRQNPEPHASGFLSLNLNKKLEKIMSTRIEAVSPVFKSRNEFFDEEPWEREERLKNGKKKKPRCKRRSYSGNFRNSNGKFR